jgi:hypothetical protein
MTSTERNGFVAVGMGVLVILIALLADPIGIGGATGFGWKQIFLLALGVVVSVVGATVVARSRPSGGPPPDL